MKEKARRKEGKDRGKRHKLRVEKMHTHTHTKINRGGIKGK